LLYGEMEKTAKEFRDVLARREKQGWCVRVM